MTYPVRGRRRGCAALASSDRSTSLRVTACSAASRGRGVELNGEYWQDGVRYLREQEAQHDVPTLFDLLDSEAS